MTHIQKPSKTLHVSLWVLQIVVALFLVMGAIMKFVPIDKLSTMMPWTGDVSPITVRVLGIVDLLGALGLILPGLLNKKTKLTLWAARGIVLLMLSTIIFHLSRGEASVIGFNIFLFILAAFITFGRKKIKN